VSRYAFLFLLAAVCAACKPAPTAPRSAAAQPTVRATVVTIRTIEEKKTHDHAIVILGDKARDTSEHDKWRLFDTKANTVTFVDDVAKTVRTEPIAEIVRMRRAAEAGLLPAHFPAARIERTNERRPMHGTTVRQSVVEAGAYRRELWIGEHPAIPGSLFAMMHASAPPSSPLAPMMRSVDEALMETSGFPLLDRTTVPFGKTNLTIERRVIGIGQRDVAESLLTVPRDYRDVTPQRAASGVR
jgi:hypothetical protein